MYLLTHRRNIGLDRAIQQASVDLFHHLLHRIGNFPIEIVKWSITYPAREITAGALTFPGKLDQFKDTGRDMLHRAGEQTRRCLGQLRYWSVSAPIAYAPAWAAAVHLMIAFAFESQVFGQYRASVADIPYQLASVINQPATLFFSGEPPPPGPVVIKLISATDEVTVFQETYTPPLCGAT